MKKPKRARWYRTVTTLCPPCGAESVVREAQYTTPPAKARRYVTEQHYNYCVERANVA